MFVCICLDSKTERCSTKDYTKSSSRTCRSFPLPVEIVSFRIIGGGGYDSLQLNLITARGGQCISGFRILDFLHPLDGKCLEKEEWGVERIKHI